MSTFLPVCPNTGIERISCPCSSCAEHREVLREKIRKEEEDREWSRREASRRNDRDQWLRTNGRCW